MLKAQALLEAQEKDAARHEGGILGFYHGARGTAALAAGEYAMAVRACSAALQEATPTMRP